LELELSSSDLEILHRYENLATFDYTTSMQFRTKTNEKLRCD